MTGPFEYNTLAVGALCLVGSFSLGTTHILFGLRNYPTVHWAYRALIAVACAAMLMRAGDLLSGLWAGKPQEIGWTAVVTSVVLNMMWVAQLYTVYRKKLPAEAYELVEAAMQAPPEQATAILAGNVTEFRKRR